MPKDSSIRKVLVIGSGPIVIGQAAEFVTQARRRVVFSEKKELMLYL